MLLQRSTCQLVCGWYAVFVIFLEPRCVRRVPKNLLTNCFPLSGRRHDGIPYAINHVSKNIYAREVFVILAVGMARLVSVSNTCLQ